MKVWVNVDHFPSRDEICLGDSSFKFQKQRKSLKCTGQKSFFSQGSNSVMQKGMKISCCCFTAVHPYFITLSSVHLFLHCSFTKSYTVKLRKHFTYFKNITVNEKKLLIHLLLIKFYGNYKQSISLKDFPLWSLCKCIYFRPGVCFLKSSTRLHDKKMFTLAKCS